MVPESEVVMRAWIAPLLVLAGCDQDPSPVAGPSPAQPGSSTLKGTWKAEIVSLTLEDPEGAISLPVRVGDSFDLTIVEKSGRLYIDGPQPVELQREGPAWVGQAGRVSARVVRVGKRLSGEWVRPGPRDSRMRIEFSADPEF
jgi:hypothetical protein